MKESLINKFWDSVHPALMLIRDFLIFTKLIRHNYRQPFHLAFLKANKSQSDFIAYLESIGFVNHFFAWDDPGQKYSLRKRVNFTYQYHLRIFEDGEIRGHFELTPEAHPIKHLLGRQIQARTEDFMNFLQDWAVARMIAPPKFSFIIPAFNEQEFIGQCIESIVKQVNETQIKTEIVVVNNASTDNTRQIAESYRVKVVDEPRKGLARARQAGFAAAMGEIIVNLDADSMLSEGYLEKIYNIFDNPQVLALTGPVIFYDLSLAKNLAVRIYYYGAFLLHKIKAMLFGKSSLAQGSNFAIRKKALHQIGGYNTDINFFGEDTDLAERLNRIGRVNFDFKIPIYTSGRRIQEAGLMTVAWQYAINHFWIILFRKPYHFRYEDIRKDNFSRFKTDAIKLNRGLLVLSLSCMVFFAITSSIVYEFGAKTYVAKISGLEEKQDKLSIRQTIGYVWSSVKNRKE